MFLGMSGHSGASVDGADEDDSDLCVVCIRKEACMISVPCAHECLCDKCARVLMRTNARCPLCRTVIEGFTQRQGGGGRRTHAETLAAQQRQKEPRAQEAQLQQELHVRIASTIVSFFFTVFWASGAAFKMRGEPYHVYVVMGILFTVEQIHHVWLNLEGGEAEEEEQQEHAEKNKLLTSSPLFQQQPDVPMILIRVAIKTVSLIFIAWSTGYAYTYSTMLWKR